MGGVGGVAIIGGVVTSDDVSMIGEFICLPDGHHQKCQCRAQAEEG